MMIVRYYKNSVLASLVSIFGCAFIYIGAMGCLQEHEPAALALVPIGLLPFYAASKISEHKAFRKWRKTLREKGVEEQMRSDLPLAVSVYNSNPGKSTQKYIATLNPAAGQYIASSLAAK